MESLILPFFLLKINKIWPLLLFFNVIVTFSKERILYFTVVNVAPFFGHLFFGRFRGTHPVKKMGLWCKYCSSPLFLFFVLLESPYPPLYGRRHARSSVFDTRSREGAENPKKSLSLYLVTFHVSLISQPTEELAVLIPHMAPFPLSCWCWSCHLFRSDMFRKWFLTLAYGRRACRAGRCY